MSQRPWTTALVHPVPLLAAALLAINDHVLKGSGLLPGWLTGKLSDFAGLFVFPVLLATLCGWLLCLAGQQDRAERRTIAVWSIAATGVVFTAIKLWPWFNQFTRPVLGPNLVDPSDLIAMPMLGLAGLWLARRPGGTSAAGLGRVAMVSAVALACAATSAPRYARNYPSWEVRGDMTTHSACAEAMAWVVKSGKSGFGVTVAVRAISVAGCTVSIPQASLTLGGRPIGAVAEPAELELRHCEAGYLYLPIRFDNEAAWNRGLRSGKLDITLLLGDRRHDWQLHAEQELRAYHSSRWSPDDGEAARWPRSCGGARLEQAER